MLAYWKYARWRNRHFRTRAIFAVAISPVASPLAGKVMAAFTKITKVKAGAAIELRLEQAMRSLGVWRTQRDD